MVQVAPAVQENPAEQAALRVALVVPAVLLKPMKPQTPTKTAWYPPRKPPFMP
jgi:hypothetical protein